MEAMTVLHGVVPKHDLDLLALKPPDGALTTSGTVRASSTVGTRETIESLPGSPLPPKQ